MMYSCALLDGAREDSHPEHIKRMTTMLFFLQIISKTNFDGKGNAFIAFYVL